MVLDARLTMMASMHSAGKNLADVGTDHAYIPIAILQKDAGVRCIASDIHKGPLQVAMENAQATHLNQRMVFVLADGLDGLPLEEEQIKEIFICGMGGETIISILEASDYVRRSDVRLFLQPMTKIPELRLYLASSGFTVEKEALATDGKRVYVGMEVSYTGQIMNLSFLETRVGKLLLENAKNEPLFSLWVMKEKEKIEEKIKGKALGGTVDEEDASYLKDLQNLLEEYQ